MLKPLIAPLQSKEASCSKMPFAGGCQGRLPLSKVLLAVLTQNLGETL